MVINELDKTGKVLKPTDKDVKPILLMFGMAEGSSFDSMMELFSVKSTNQTYSSFRCILTPKKSSMRRGRGPLS